MVELKIFYPGDAFDKRPKRDTQDASNACKLLKPNTPVEILVDGKVWFKGTAYQASK